MMAKKLTAHRRASPQTPPELESSAVSISVTVTDEIREAFRGMSMHGQGGFQRLARRIATRLESEDEVISFEAEEFQRILRYAAVYGNGGYQLRFRLLVTTWAAQTQPPPD